MSAGERTHEQVDLRETDAPSDSRLARQVAARIAVLPVLATQLRETAQQVERSVIGVCGSFHGMATRLPICFVVLKETILLMLLKP